MAKRVEIFFKYDADRPGAKPLVGLLYSVMQELVDCDLVMSIRNWEEEESNG